MSDESSGLRQHFKWIGLRSARPSHHLSLRDYIGPHAVGPQGYRPVEVAALDSFFQVNRQAHEERGSDEFPILENPHRPDLIFRGTNSNACIFAFDASSGAMVGMMSNTGLFCVPEARGQGIGSEFYWLLHASNPLKPPSIMDFTRSGFMACVKSHGLILNRETEEIPIQALEGYRPDGSGWVLSSRPDMETWNANWGIDYDHSAVNEVQAEQDDDLSP